MYTCIKSTGLPEEIGNTGDRVSTERMTELDQQACERPADLICSISRNIYDALDEFPVAREIRKDRAVSIRSRSSWLARMTIDGQNDSDELPPTPEACKRSAARVAVGSVGLVFGFRNRETRRKRIGESDRLVG